MPDTTPTDHNANASAPVEDFPDLSCPGCGSDLSWDDLFLSHRVCSQCRRHFFLSSRERLAVTVNSGSFQETGGDFATLAPFGEDEAPARVPSPAQRLADSRERDLISEAVVSGIGRIGNEDAVFIFLDEHATGTTIGALTAEKIVLAMELAAQRRLPLVMFVSGGNASTSAGPLSLAQPSRIAAAGAQLHLAGVPTFAVLCQSASSELVGTLAGQCDFVIAEPGTRVWDRRHFSAAGPGESEPVEEMHARGVIDDVIDRETQQAWIGNALDLFGRRGVSRAGFLPGATVPDRESRTGAVRPAANEYLDHIMVSRLPIGGDRAFSDSRDVVAGFGRIDGLTVAFAAFDRTEPVPESDVAASRKLVRLIGLATRFEVPTLFLVGHDRTVTLSSAEAMAIAKLTGVLTVAPISITTAIVGDVRSSLGRALVSADRVLCQAGATFGIEGTPPGPGRMPGANWTQLTAAEAQRLGLVDEVVTEVPDSTERRLAENGQMLQDAVKSAFAALGSTGARRRVTDRQQKLRSLGQSTPAGRAAFLDEINDWRELQRTISRSVEDWRERWDHLRSGQPRFTLQRPDLGDIASKLRARRAELLERAGRTDKFTR